MAIWSDKEGRVEYGCDVIDPDSPEWIWRDCTCCAGIEWGGESPRECGTCKGWGSYAIHAPSGAVAQWPGGPFLGREVVGINAIFDAIEASAFVGLMRMAEAIDEQDQRQGFDAEVAAEIDEDRRAAREWDEMIARDRVPR